MNRLRPLLLLACIILLLVSLWAGLLRMGWSWPTLTPTLAGLHGPLIVAGFFGALIALERAVALGQAWIYLAPLANLAGAALVLSEPATRGPGAALLVAGSLVFLLAGVVIVRRQPAAFTRLLALATLALVLGNLFWASGRPVYQVVWWWTAFLVLTIVAERLELGRLLRLPGWAYTAHWTGVGVTLAGLLVALTRPEIGVRLFGGGMLLLALWLGRFDIARHTVRRPGLPRFVATCLLSGYIWLGVGGVLILLYGPVPAGFAYDAMLHSLFVGFVFAMIFGHAPIIFPAVLSLPASFHRLMYLPLVLLSASLLVRIGGDLTVSAELRRWGGLFNALAILLYFGVTAYTIVGARLRASEDKAAPFSDTGELFTEG